MTYNKTVLTLFLILLVIPLVTALEEVHFTSDSQTATLTYISHNNILLMENSPQQKPTQPYRWISYVYTLDRRLQEIRSEEGLALKVYYRHDKQVDYIQDNDYNIQVRYLYDQSGNLLRLEYYTNTGELIQTTTVITTAYTGDNPYISNSLHQTYTTLFPDHSLLTDNPDQPFLTEEYKEFYRIIPSTTGNFPANEDFEQLTYYKIYPNGKHVDKIEYYSNGVKGKTTYYVYSAEGKLQIIYSHSELENKLQSYQKYYYHECQGDVVKSVVILDTYGARIADYVYDNADVCSPYTTLEEIRDRLTGSSLYELEYYA